MDKDMLHANMRINRNNMTSERLRRIRSGGKIIMDKITKLEIALNLIGEAAELLYQLESQLNEDEKKEKDNSK